MFGLAAGCGGKRGGFGDKVIGWRGRFGEERGGVEKRAVHVEEVEEEDGGHYWFSSLLHFFC